MKRTETKEYKEYMHNYYLKHKDKIKNRANEWQKANPEALIFLPAKEHREDYCKSTKNSSGSKWHKHLYEVNNA